MAFQVITTITPETDPYLTFIEYVKTLDSSVFEPNYPEYAGQQPIYVVTAFVDDTIYNPAVGYIDETTVVEANGRTIITQLWDTEDDYNRVANLTLYETVPTTTLEYGKISCSNSSTTITGTETIFSNTCYVGGHVHSKVDDSVEDQYYLLGTVAAINSDTELTLEQNALYTATNKSYYAHPKNTVYDYLFEMYISAYPNTITLTYNTI